MTRVISAGVLGVSGVLLGDALNANTSVKLGEALAVVMIVIPAAMWVSKHLQRISDNQVTMRSEIAALGERLKGLRDRINGLACHHGRSRPCPGLTPPPTEEKTEDEEPEDS